MHDPVSTTPPPASSLDFLKRTLLRQAFQLSSANLVAQVSRFVKNFIFAWLLGPHLFGLWNGIQVFLIYGSNAHLGVLHALAREIPLCRGRGELERIPSLARVSLAFTLLTSLVIALIVFGIGVALDPTKVETSALQLVAAVLVVQQLMLYYQFLLRAEDNFALLSKALIITAVLELAVSVAMVYWFGFTGIFYGLLISGAIGVLICLIPERQVVSRLEFDFRLVSNLVKIGFPIMLTVLSYGLLTTIDRVMVIKFLGSESLGYYAIGPLATTAIGYLPIAINQVMYPKFSERYGATGDPKSLAGFVRVSTLGTAHVMGLVLGVMFIALPLVAVFLPKYAPGIPAARIIFAGFYFICLQGACTNLLITVNRQMQYLAGMLSAVALGIALNSMALIYGFGIKGVAITTGMTYAVSAFGIIGFTVRRYLSYSGRQSGALIRKLLLPYAIAAAIVAGALQIRMESLFLLTVVQVILFAGAYVPASFFLLRRELPQ